MFASPSIHTTSFHDWLTSSTETACQYCPGTRGTWAWVWVDQGGDSGKYLVFNTHMHQHTDQDGTEIHIDDHTVTKAACYRALHRSELGAMDQ